MPTVTGQWPQLPASHLRCKIYLIPARRPRPRVCVTVPERGGHGRSPKDKSRHSMHMGECRYLLAERLGPRPLHMTLTKVMRTQQGLLRLLLPAEGTGRLSRQETASWYSGEHKHPVGYPDKHGGPLTALRMTPALPRCSSFSASICFSPISTCAT